MQQSFKCPVCGDVMMTEFDNSSVVTKKCYKYPSHWIRLTSCDVDNEIYKIQILVSNEPLVYATWHFLSKELRIHGRELTRLVGTPLPWFEPDINDYRKLVEKMRTYIVFS